MLLLPELVFDFEGDSLGSGDVWDWVVCVMIERGGNGGNVILSVCAIEVVVACWIVPITLEC